MLKSAASSPQSNALSPRDRIFIQCAPREAADWFLGHDEPRMPSPEALQFVSQIIGVSYEWLSREPLDHQDAGREMILLQAENNRLMRRNKTVIPAIAVWGVIIFVIWLLF